MPPSYSKRWKGDWWGRGSKFFSKLLRVMLRMMMRMMMSGDECWWEWCCMMRVMMRGSGWLARRAPNNPFSCWHSMDDTLSSADNLYTCHLFTDLLIIFIICHCPFFFDNFCIFLIIFVTLSLPIFLIMWFLSLCHCPYF